MNSVKCNSEVTRHRIGRNRSCLPTKSFAAVVKARNCWNCRKGRYAEAERLRCWMCETMASKCQRLSSDDLDRLAARTCNYWKQ